MGAPGAAPPSKRKSTTLRHLFELDKPDAALSGGAKLPPPSPEPEADVLIDKIKSCAARVFTFVDPSERAAEQDVKREKLLEILAFVRSSKGPLDRRVMTSLVAMLAANLLRTLPPSAYPCPSFDTVDDDLPVMVLSPSWPHLQVVYDILLAVVTSTDAKVLRNHIDRGFLSGLLALFGSEDPRERDRLKTIYHQLYSKLTGERAFMRRSMSAVFLRFTYETAAERHCGIGELLEICGSIVNGFVVPLKEEHRVFLVRVLLPLHRPKWVHMYHRQLSYCVLQFVQKEPELSEVVVRGILKYWPVTNCQKEVLLIEELEELVEVLEPEFFEKLAVPICSQIARSLNSCNSQVAERALYVWNNEQFLKMASGMMEKILPPIVEGIEKNLKLHWSKSVQQVTISVKTLLQGMEPDLYSRCVRELGTRRSEAQEEEIKRNARWERLEIAAAK